MDPSARVTMKDAAKCDKRCEWQNPANQENAERILHFQVIPESIFVSGHLYFHAGSLMSLSFSDHAAGVSVGQRRSLKSLAHEIYHQPLAHSARYLFTREYPCGTAVCALVINLHEDDTRRLFVHA